MDSIKVFVRLFSQFLLLSLLFFLFSSILPVIQNTAGGSFFIFFLFFCLLYLSLHALATPQCACISYHIKKLRRGKQVAKKRSTIHFIHKVYFIIKCVQKDFFLHKHIYPPLFIIHFILQPYLSTRFFILSIVESSFNNKKKTTQKTDILSFNRINVRVSNNFVYLLLSFTYTPLNWHRHMHICMYTSRAGCFVNKPHELKD